MIAEVYRSQSVSLVRYEFQKIRTIFFGKSCSRGFWAPGCNPGTLIDLVNVALNSRNSIEIICMIWEGCRTHRVVTGPMNFKKSGFFFGKSCSRIFGAPGSHPITLIDFVNTDLASNCSVESICIISEGYRTHGGVTGPMNFKKKDVFFGKTCSQCFGAPACHPSTLFDFVKTAVASKDSAETICMFWEGWTTHRGVDGSMNFKKNRTCFSENRAPGISGLLAAIQAP